MAGPPKANSAQFEEVEAVNGSILDENKIIVFGKENTTQNRIYPVSSVEMKGLRAMYNTRRRGVVDRFHGTFRSPGSGRHCLIFSIGMMWNILLWLGMLSWSLLCVGLCLCRSICLKAIFIFLLNTTRENKKDYEELSHIPALNE